MRTLRPYLMLTVIVVSLCFYGVQGQYYSSMPSVSGSSNHISAPVQTMIVGNIPATINLGTQQQSVSNSQYQTSTNNAGTIPMDTRRWGLDTI